MFEVIALVILLVMCIPFCLVVAVAWRALRPTREAFDPTRLFRRKD